MEHRINGVLAEAWHHAYLYALTKTKKFPKSPADLWKKAPSEEDVTATLLANAKARKSAQDRAAKRAGKPPRERTIMREE